MEGRRDWELKHNIVKSEKKKNTHKKKKNIEIKVHNKSQIKQIVRSFQPQWMTTVGLKTKKKNYIYKYNYKYITADTNTNAKVRMQNWEKKKIRKKKLNTTKKKNQKKKSKTG